MARMVCPHPFGASIGFARHHGPVGTGRQMEFRARSRRFWPKPYMEAVPACRTHMTARRARHAPSLRSCHGRRTGSLRRGAQEPRRADRRATGRIPGDLGPGPGERADRQGDAGDGGVVGHRGRDGARAARDGGDRVHAGARRGQGPGGAGRDPGQQRAQPGRAAAGGAAARRAGVGAGGRGGAAAADGAAARAGQQRRGAQRAGGAHRGRLRDAAGHQPPRALPAVPAAAPAAAGRRRGGRRRARRQRLVGRAHALAGAAAEPEPGRHLRAPPGVRLLQDGQRLDGEPRRAPVLQAADAEQINQRLAADESLRRARKSVDQGAATQVWAAVAPVWKGRGGVYLEDMRVSHETATPSLLWGGHKSFLFDEESERELWRISNDMVGFKDDEE